MNKDTNSGYNQKKPKAFKDLINMMNVTDTYREYNKTKKAFTFFKVSEEGELIKSRLDYIFGPINKKDWHSSIIYTKDHQPIGSI